MIASARVSRCKKRNWELNRVWLSAFPESPSTGLKVTAQDSSPANAAALYECAIRGGESTQDFTLSADVSLEEPEQKARQFDFSQALSLSCFSVILVPTFKIANAVILRLRSQLN